MVDYFSEFFAANDAKSEEDGAYVILPERCWFTHYTPSGITGLSDDNAPEIDGVTTEIVKLGCDALCSVMLPPYRVTFRSGYAPEN